MSGRAGAFARRLRAYMREPATRSFYAVTFLGMAMVAAVIALCR